MNDMNDDFDQSDWSAPERPKEKPKGGRGAEYPPPFSLSKVDLLRPPGLSGEVADWIDSQCRYPRRRLAVAAALATVGNIGGLRHEDTHDGITANIIAFCVAASSTGKEAVQQAMSQLHQSVGMGRAVVGGIKSEQEIVRNLIEHQPAYYIVDEIGIFLTKIRNAQQRGGAAYLEGVFGTIMSAYSKASAHMLLGGDTKRELRKGYAGLLSKADNDGDEEGKAYALRMLAMLDQGLERPFLSIVGYTTPSTFDAVMDGETAAQGFVGRSIIITEPEDNPKARKAFKRPKIPQGLSQRLSQLRFGGAYDLTKDKGRIEYLSEERQPVTTDAAAVIMLDQITDWLHDYADEMGEHTGAPSIPIVRRAYEMIAKVSFILAIPDGVRTAEHVRWAFAYVRAELDNKIALVFANDNAKDRPEEALAARIMGLLDTEKGATIAVLANRMHLKTEGVLPILQKMESAGMVREQGSARKYRGKEVTVWVRVEG